MFSLKNRQPKPVFEMDPSNIFAGAIIGDCGIEMCVMHMDPGGAMHPIWANRIPIKVQPSVTPSVKQITNAIVEAWNAKHNPYRIHYNHFFLCLPSWVCSTTTDSREITIPDKSDFGIHRTHEITPEDVRKLKTTTSTDGIPENQLVVDLITHSFVLDTKRRVMDPCGNISRSLELESLVSYSEAGVTRAILECLKEQDIEVDVMMSPFAAHAGMLSPAEKESGAVVIDVGRRNTACSFFKEGILRHSTLLRTGSDNILGDIADKLNLSTHEAELIVEQQQDLIRRSDTSHKIHSLPLFAWGAAHPATRRLGGVAALSTQNIFTEISRRIKSISFEMMINTKAVIFVGDDNLTVQILQEMFQDAAEFPSRIATGSAPVSDNSACADCHTRTTGFMKHAMRCQGRFQLYLEQYNESAPELLARNLSSKVADLCTWSLEKVKAVARKKPADSTLPNIITKTPPARIHTISFSQARESMSIPLS